MLFQRYRRLGRKRWLSFCLNLGFEFKHDKPMGVDELKEFVANPPEARGFASHTKKGLEIKAAKKIIQLLEKNN